MRVLEHATGLVYIADESGNPIPHPELQRTTFIDYNGAAHTVHTHVDGPFTDPHDIIAAFYQGDLHPNPSPPEEDAPSDEGREGRV